MTVFWVLAGCMLIVAFLFTLPGLLRTHSQPDTDLDTVNTAVIKAQLAELDSDLSNGRLDEAQYLAAREDLERELLADLSDTNAGQGEMKVRGGRWAALLLIVLIPGLTIGLYQIIGTQQIIPLLANAGTGVARQATTPAGGAPSLAELVGRLAERLQQEPDNAEGWIMLGRSYMTLQRFDDAAVAYARAHQLVGDDADLLADYADALAMADGRGFTDQAGDLLMKALAAEPGNVKVLWLAGHWKSQQGDYVEAIRYWQGAAAQLPPDGEDAPLIAEQIRLAHEQLAPGEVLEAAPSRQPTAGMTAAAAGKAITVSITLDPQIAAAASPGDTLFVFARAVSGPRMPLAIVRKQVSDLPLTITLDDSTAMAPSMKLSNFDSVTVGARISKSGTAMPQSGDLQGQVTPVVPGAEPAIMLNIDSRVP
ncbi:MAG: c-type cytochrome biogenesis protein CcmI [Gammaproteobacteria bacterium]